MLPGPLKPGTTTPEGGAGIASPEGLNAVDADEVDTPTSPDVDVDVRVQVPRDPLTLLARSRSALPDPTSSKPLYFNEGKDSTA